MNILGFKIGEKDDKVAEVGQAENTLGYEEQAHRNTIFAAFIEDQLKGIDDEGIFKASPEEQFSAFAEAYHRAIQEIGIETTLEIDFPGIKGNYLQSRTLPAGASEVGDITSPKEAILGCMYMIGKANNS